jgi:hypothetical protein
VVFRTLAAVYGPGERGKSMKRILRVQVAIAALALLVGICAYVTTLPQAKAFLGVCTYYQTAAMKKVVGQRGTGCCGEPVSWGVVTPYRTCEQIYCLDVWCPPPTE